jgi:hypothetical protein
MHNPSPYLLGIAGKKPDAQKNQQQKSHAPKLVQIAFPQGGQSTWATLSPAQCVCKHLLRMYLKR